jgi:hypothetical protein
MLSCFSNSAFGFKYYKILAEDVPAFVSVLNGFFNTPTIENAGRDDYNSTPGNILNGDWYADNGNWRFYNNFSVSNGACFYTYTGNMESSVN